MERQFPKSLLFFAATAVAYLAQTIPAIGVFLMIVLAMFWSVALVNAGMIGIISEVHSKQVSYKWLLIPIIFYGGYYAFVAMDRLTLHKLREANDAKNAQVSVPFDPARQALVLIGNDLSPRWLVAHHRIPVVYWVPDIQSHRMSATRLARGEDCRGWPGMYRSGVNISWVDGDKSDRSRPAGMVSPDVV